jgi:phosphoribosylpyrophosphate synthetase
MTLLSLPPDRLRQDVEVDALDPCRIFAGNASRRLAKAICEKLDVPLGDADVGRFEDGEVSVRFNENIRGSDVSVSHGRSSGHGLMELLVMLGTAKRASTRQSRPCCPLRLRAAGPKDHPARR